LAAKTILYYGLLFSSSYYSAQATTKIIATGVAVIAMITTVTVREIAIVA